jgi:hypothetical protein
MLPSPKRKDSTEMVENSSQIMAPMLKTPNKHSFQSLRLNGDIQQMNY